MLSYAAKERLLEKTLKSLELVLAVGPHTFYILVLRQVRDFRIDGLIPIIFVKNNASKGSILVPSRLPSLFTKNTMSSE